MKELIKLDAKGTKVYVCDKPLTKYHGNMYQASNLNQLVDYFLKTYPEFVYRQGREHKEFAWFELEAKKLRFGNLDKDVIKFAFKVLKFEEYKEAKDKAEKRKALMSEIDSKYIDTSFFSSTTTVKLEGILK